MNKFISNFNGLIWTVAGTALVLITLSGATQKIGLWISAGAFVLNVIGMVIERDE